MKITRTKESIKKTLIARCATTTTGTIKVKIVTEVTTSPDMYFDADSRDCSFINFGMRTVRLG